MPYAVHTKSSLMVGLGETRDELREAFDALREVDCDILTIGQYLRPSLKHLPVERYYHPDEFAEMKVEALELGFKHVESAPLVRSSYHARDQVPGAELKALRRRQATLDAARSRGATRRLGTVHAPPASRWRRELRRRLTVNNPAAPADVCRLPVVVSARLAAPLAPNRALRRHRVNELRHLPIECPLAGNSRPFHRPF